MNSGDHLRPFEYENLEKGMIGRFGATGYSEYGLLEIGKIYKVMGIIIFKSYQAYLIDDNEIIGVCPCQLFDIIDGTIDSSWSFRLVDSKESIYPFIQAFLGYYEFCFDLGSYEKLIIEKASEAYKIYFSRKSS